MRLIADTPAAIRTMAEMLEIPRDLINDLRLSDEEFQRRLDWCGLHVSIKVIRRFRGTQ
jgi:hypothetical protein